LQAKQFWCARSGARDGDVALLPQQCAITATARRDSKIVNRDIARSHTNLLAWHECNTAVARRNHAYSRDAPKSIVAKEIAR